MWKRNFVPLLPLLQLVNELADGAFCVNGLDYVISADELFDDLGFQNQLCDLGIGLFDLHAVYVDGLLFLLGDNPYHYRK